MYLRVIGTVKHCNGSIHDHARDGKSRQASVLYGGHGGHAIRRWISATDNVAVDYGKATVEESVGRVGW